MGMDEQWASCYPYRSVTKKGSQVEIQVRVRNHLGEAAEAKAELRCPTDWVATPVFLSAVVEKKSNGTLKFKLAIPKDAPAGRYVVTANVVFAGKDYGEIAEAVVDIGEQ